MNTPEQMLAARALLRWTSDDLAEKIRGGGDYRTRLRTSQDRPQGFNGANGAARWSMLAFSLLMMMGRGGGVGVRLRSGVKVPTVKKKR
jgi:hypothetical protein